MSRHLAELVRAAAARSPDKPALICADDMLSWGALDYRVDQVAGSLRGRGLGRGDRVAIMLPNTLAFPAIYFGALRAGGVAVPVNTGYTEPEVSHLVDDSGARWLVGAPEHAGLLARVARSRAGVQVLDAAALYAGGTTAPDEVTSPASGGASGGGQALDATGSEDLAVLLYTSGTSGRPKGAMLSHRALWANLDQMARIEPAPLGAADVVLLVLPLFHVYGLGAGLGAVAWHAATGVLVDRFDPADTLREVTDRGVSVVLGAPPVYVAWSARPDAGPALAGVRLLLSGAAPLPLEVAARMQEVAGRPVHQGYGLTEAAPVVTTSLCSAVVKPGSIGRSVPGVTVRLCPETGDVVEEGDVGELVVRGANLFSGYWPDRAGGPDSDGWFRTGDLGYADADGDLYLVGRQPELILVSGFNVYPREVEDVLRSHSDVAEVAVLGVPNPVTGESVRAFVVPRAGSSLGARELVEALTAHAARSLARFKCPTEIELVEALPHSDAGKVATGRLREQTRARAARQDQIPSVGDAAPDGPD